MNIPNLSSEGIHRGSYRRGFEEAPQVVVRADPPSLVRDEAIEAGGDEEGAAAWGLGSDGGTGTGTR